jgi:zinc transporter ZupT
MNVLSLEWIALLLALGVLGGAALVEWSFKTFTPSAKLLLAFSGAFLFSTTVFVWLPEVFSDAGHGHGHSHSVAETGSTALAAGTWVMVGFLVQYLLDFATRGLEHGHVHHGGSPWGALLGLVVHSTLEGLPLAGMDPDQRLAFGTAIALHNLPVSMVVALWLRECGMTFRLRWTALSVFALSTPVGVLLGSLLDAPDAPFHTASMGLVAGIFLHVSTTILFENQKDHKFNAEKLAVVLLGTALAWASQMVLNPG